MITKKPCPKCTSDMVEGLYSGSPTYWLQQEEHSFIQGSGKRIISYACDRCGYVENYVKK